MRGYQLARRVLSAMAVAALLAGCGSATKDSADTTGSGPAGSTASVSGDAGGASSSDETNEATSPPPVEGSGPESPQPQQNGGPSITVASLPVGGVGTPDPANPDQQCGSVNWLLGPLPSGVLVQLGDISFDPTGIFKQGGSGCGSDQPVCDSGTTWTAGSSGCSVPVIQLDAGSEADVAIVVAGKISCPSQAVCDQLRNQLDGHTGSQAIVTAVAHDAQSSDTASPSETPSPSDTDQASSSPAGS